MSDFDTHVMDCAVMIYGQAKIRGYWAGIAPLVEMELMA